MGDFDQQPPTPRQIAAAQALIAYLSQRYNIAPSGIRTHAHLAATQTVCPGKYFPSEADAQRHQGRACRSARPRHLEGRPRHDTEMMMRITSSRTGPATRAFMYEPAGTRTPSLRL